MADIIKLDGNELYDCRAYLVLAWWKGLSFQLLHHGFVSWLADNAPIVTILGEGGVQGGRLFFNFNLLGKLIVLLQLRSNFLRHHNMLLLHEEIV